MSKIVGLKGLIDGHTTPWLRLGQFISQKLEGTSPNKNFYREWYSSTVMLGQFGSAVGWNKKTAPKACAAMSF